MYTHKYLYLFFTFPESLQYLFLHSICWAFLAVAVVRRKVCECRGRASILVTKVYAIRTCIICTIPIVAMVMVLLSFTNNALNDEQSRYNETNVWSIAMFSSRVFGHQYRSFEVCQILLINFFPLALGCFFYLRILYVVNQAAQSMERVTHRNRNPSRVIAASVIVLLTTTMLIWMLYIICSAVAFTIHISKHVFMYLKLIIFVLYPFGDGLFVGSKKSKLHVGVSSNSFLVNKTRARISPVMEEASDMDDLTHPALKGIMNITVTEREDDSSVSVSPTDSTGSLNALPVYAIPSRSMATPKGEIYPSTSSDYIDEAGKPYRKFMKTSNSMDDIEDEKDKEMINFRHTFEKLRSHTTKKYSDPTLIGKGKLMSLQQPLLSPMETRVGLISGSVFEKLSESPELSRKSASPITTKEGYSGLQYSKHLQSDTCAISDRTVVLEQDNRKRRQSRWSKVFPLIRDQSPIPQQRSDHTQFEMERRTSAKLIKPSNRKKVLTRQKSKYSCFDQYYALPHVETISNLGYRSPGTKTRSISCVNNVYMDARRSSEMRANKAKTRNKSVSFMSSFHVDDSIERYTVNQDPEMNVRFGKRRRRGKSMEKSPSFDLAEIIRRKTKHWMLEKSTSKEECISKLQELNEYF